VNFISKGGDLVDRPPDTSELEKVSPTAEENVQPDWIREQYPDYVENHVMHHPLNSVRTFTHAGHQVKITTTYQIEVDGVPVQVHASVDNQGWVFSHATPFVNYGSATGLVKALIDRFPKSFTNLGDRGQEHDHGHEEAGHDPA
jgi:hypothetical protein